jgi:hypothetical protein
MKLLVKRMENDGVASTGDLFIDGVFFCHTLEDHVRGAGIKVQDETAIPPGIYKIIVGPSPAHQMKLFPRIQNVPMFTGILIHSGNDAVDTKGCILVGQTIQQGAERIIGGSIIFPILLAKIQSAIEVGNEVTIEIQNCFAA